VNHFDDSIPAAEAGSDLVAGRHGRGRFRGSTVDAHVPAATGRGGVRPGLGQPDRPQPPIHPDGLHVPMMADVPYPRRQPGWCVSPGSFRDLVVWQRWRISAIILGIGNTDKLQPRSADEQAIAISPSIRIPATAKNDTIRSGPTPLSIICPAHFYRSF
jgi:hypothetical protein